MKFKTALFLLDDPGQDSVQEIHAAFDKKQDELKRRIERATTPALKEKYEKKLSDIQNARDTLVSNLQKSDKTHAQGLSFTKIVDLPAAAPFVTGSGAEGVNPSRGVSFTKGEVIGERFEIIDEVGRGGMGVVYSAFDRNRNETIAIKAMLPQYTNNATARDRFISEAKLSSTLSHPNIVNVFDVQEQDGVHFLSMELLQGRTLREILDLNRQLRKQMDITEIKGILNQLVEALAYAHTKTIHRDIKPENVFVCNDGTVKLMDFGIACVLDPEQFTMTMTAAGTPYYMSPEQLRGDADIGPNSDQYACAVIAYEMVTGKMPIGKALPASEIRKECSASFSKVIDRALSPEASGRFDGMKEFGAAMDKKSMPGFSKQAAGIAAVLILGVAMFLGREWLGATYTQLVSGGQEKREMFIQLDSEISQREAEIQKFIEQLKETAENNEDKLDQLKSRVERGDDSISGNDQLQYAALSKIVEWDEFFQEVLDERIYPMSSRANVATLKKHSKDAYDKNKLTIALEKNAEVNDTLATVHANVDVIVGLSKGLSEIEFEMQQLDPVKDRNWLREVSSVGGEIRVALETGDAAELGSIVEQKMIPLRDMIATIAARRVLDETYSGVSERRMTAEYDRALSVYTRVRKAADGALEDGRYEEATELFENAQEYVHRIIRTFDILTELEGELSKKVVEIDGGKFFSEFQKRLFDLKGKMRTEEFNLALAGMSDLVEDFRTSSSIYDDYIASAEFIEALSPFASVEECSELFFKSRENLDQVDDLLVDEKWTEIGYLLQDIRKNHEQALQFARVNAGEIFLSGKAALDRSDASAVSLLNIAADNGHGEAQLVLGAVYHKGNAHQGIDLNQAGLWYEKASENNVSEAWAGLGSLSSERRNYPAAVAYLTRGVELGEPTAEYLLAAILHKGKSGVEADSTTAYKLASSSAEKGNVSAEVLKARMLLAGEGTYPDASRAIEILERLSETEEAEGVSILIADAYYHGEGVKKDRATAYRWYSTVQGKHSAEAHLKLGVMSKQGDGTTRNLKKAKQYLEAAIKLGNKDAILQHAKISYETGDYPNSIKSFTELSRGGNGEASYLLGESYLKGKGVVRDESDAMRYYNLSVKQGYLDGEKGLLSLRRLDSLKSEREQAIQKIAQNRSNISQLKANSRAIDGKIRSIEAQQSKRQVGGFLSAVVALANDDIVGYGAGLMETSDLSGGNISALRAQQRGIDEQVRLLEGNIRGLERRIQEIDRERAGITGR